MNRRGNSSAAVYEVRAGLLLQRHYRGISEQTAKLCHLTDSLTVNGDNSYGGRLGVYNAYRYLVGYNARDCRCICVAGYRDHIKSYRAYGRHRLKLFERQRAAFEKYNVFSPAMIDGIIKKLRSYGDRTLRADIGTNQEEMLKLVNRYFHCG